MVAIHRFPVHISSFLRRNVPVFYWAKDQCEARVTPVPKTIIYIRNLWHLSCTGLSTGDVQTSICLLSKPSFQIRGIQWDWKGSTSARRESCMWLRAVRDEVDERGGVMPRRTVGTDGFQVRMLLSGERGGQQNMGTIIIHRVGF